MRVQGREINRAQPPGFGSEQSDRHKTPEIKRDADQYSVEGGDHAVRCGMQYRPGLQPARKSIDQWNERTVGEELQLRKFPFESGEIPDKHNPGRGSIGPAQRAGCFRIAT